MTPFPASRLTLGALAGLIVLVLAAGPVNALLPEHFATGNIRFRDWMIRVNAILAVAHGLALATLWLGLRSHPRAALLGLRTGVMLTETPLIFTIVLTIWP